MLEDLSISNFALINSAEVEFSSGFTVLSGETGAGKSILIGALSFLLGGKSSTDFIRSGADSASVSGTFCLQPSVNIASGVKSVIEMPYNWLAEHAIEIEDNRVLLRRIIKSNGKTSAWIENIPVTRSDLIQFSAFLVDIHGQHDHQSLMNVQTHHQFLDSYAGLTSEVEKFSEQYLLLVSLRSKYSKLSMDETERERKKEILSFAVKEITDAKIKQNEDIELQEQESKLSSYEKIYELITSINTVFSESDESVISKMKYIKNSSAKVAELDSTQKSLHNRIENVFYELSDIAEEYRDYEQNLVFDPSRLEEIQNRLSDLYNLKKKYASSPAASLDEVLQYEKNASDELEKINNYTNERSALINKLHQQEKIVYLAAKEISEKRQSVAPVMSKEIEGVLKKLGMPSSVFKVNIETKQGSEFEQKCGKYGIDNIEFLITANPGSPLLPLSKIASGGELSRVMLALKTVFARTDPVQTMVFDEIDTGIGGEVAVEVGSHLKKLAKNKQILCITHLASIAVYADNQLKIEKLAENGSTETSIYCIDGNKRIAEIARMLSGDIESEESLKHARSMLEKYGR